MEAASPTIPYTRSAGLPVRLALAGDERLARLVTGGDDRAFTLLFERYHQPLYRYCRSILRDDCDAQDALQAAFAGALVALRRGQRDAPLRPWLYRIAHNEAISLIRRHGAGVELADGVGPCEQSAEERVEGRERLALLVADLLQLGERQRGAIVMRELSGLSHDEIAVALSTSVGTAKQAIFEARAALAEFAEGRAMSCEEICRTISDGDRRMLRGRRVRAHLRDCAACTAFAAAIPARRAELRALAVPLSPFAAAGVLGRLIGRGSAHTAVSGGGAGAGGAATTVAGKIASVGLVSKAVVVAAVMTGTAAGVTGVFSHSGPRGPHASLARATANRATSPAVAGHRPAHRLASGARSGSAVRTGSSHRAAARKPAHQSTAPGSKSAVSKASHSRRSGSASNPGRGNGSAGTKAGAHRGAQQTHAHHGGAQAGGRRRGRAHLRTRTSRGHQHPLKTHKTRSATKRLLPTPRPTAAPSKSSAPAGHGSKRSKTSAQVV